MNDKEFIQWVGKVADKMSDGMAIALTMGGMVVGIIINMCL